MFLLVRNIQKSKEIFSQVLVAPEDLLGDQAQIKKDLTVLPENAGLESSRLVRAECVRQRNEVAIILGIISPLLSLSAIYSEQTWSLIG